MNPERPERIGFLTRSLAEVVVVLLIGLEIFTADGVGKTVQTFGLWLAATGLLYGSGALVLWPQQLVTRNAGNVGTRRPAMAFGFGIFGLLLAIGFEILAGGASGKFNWPTFVLACAASGLCAAVGLARLGQQLRGTAIGN